MNVPIVVALLFVFPIASIVIDVAVDQQAVFGAAVVGKWFVFWAVGVRLLLAGVRQILQPRYTAETILGLKNLDSLILVRELGFANTAIGSIGVGSLFAPSWVLPAAIAGTIFYGFAGINHALHGGRNRLQNIAMISDLFVAAILLAFCVSVAVR
jgi:hypothetical protein